MTCLILCPTFLRKFSSACLLCSVTPGHPWKIRICIDRPASSSVWSVAKLLTFIALGYWPLFPSPWYWRSHWLWPPWASSCICPRTDGRGCGQWSASSRGRGWRGEDTRWPASAPRSLTPGGSLRGQHGSVTSARTGGQSPGRLSDDGDSIGLGTCYASGSYSHDDWSSCHHHYLQSHNHPRND